MKRTALFLALLTLALTLLPGCTPPEEDPAALDAKPVIYLYPEAETEVTVSLDYGGELTCVYPAFDGGTSWSVTAAPDGTLTDAAGQTYNYLYWEGVSDAEYDFSEGFCVPGGDTAAFLEDALAALGLNRREANEFIVYWLPRMEGNAYNLISFQTSAYTDRPGSPWTRRRTRCCGCSWPGSRWSAPWSSRPRLSPRRSAPASPWWSGAARSSHDPTYTKEESPCPIRLSSCWTSAGSTTSSSPAGSVSAASTAR